MQPYSLFTGAANPDLADAVSGILDHRLSPGQFSVYPDGEMSVRLDEPVRGHAVFVLQSTSPPVTSHLFQLLLFSDACRRAAASSITAVMPYFGYARSDKRHARREAIAASMVANLLETVGVNHVVTIDFHTEQVAGFFQVPVDNITAVPTLCDELKGRLASETVVVSPDEGRLNMAIQYGQRLGLPVTIIHKQRRSGIETRVVQVAGDVRDRPCLIVDDMISTGETLERAMDALLKAGAQPEFHVAATHGVLLEGARGRLTRPGVREIIVTDSVAPHEMDWPELKVVSIAPLLAGAIHRLAANQSLGDLFV